MQRDLVVRADATTVPLLRVASPADAMVTRALNTPCLFIALSRAGWQQANLMLTD